MPQDQGIDIGLDQQDAGAQAVAAVALPGLLSAAQLASCQATAALVLTQSAQVLRNSPARGSSGSAAAWAVAAGGVPCRAFGDEDVVDAMGESPGARQSAITTWDVALPAGTDVRPKDRLLIGPLTLEVVGSNAGQADQIQIMCLCRMVL
jgi:hypothetical protein